MEIGTPVRTHEIVPLREPVPEPLEPTQEPLREPTAPEEEPVYVEP